MSIFTRLKNKDGHDSESQNISECAQQISQLVLERCTQEDGRVNAETMLAIVAALTGAMVRRGGKDLVAADEQKEANTFLESTSLVLQKILGAKKGDNTFASFDTFLSQTLDNKDYRNKLVLTNEAYHAPHEDPALAAAAMREDIIFLGNEYGLSEQTLAGACSCALGMTAHQVAGVLQPAVAYKMAMEVAVGVAYMDPLDRALIPVVPEPVFTHRIVAAGSEISEIFLKQCHSLADGGMPHIPTMVAVAGAFLGVVTHKAFVKQAFDGNYVSSTAADTFLEECNIHIMASYIRRGGDAKELAEYGEYAANAAASIGHDPYPKHNVERMYLPQGFPAGQATFARDPAHEVAKKYNLLDWEMASACFVAVNDHVRIAELFITPPVAARLAMEEAAAIARIKPIDLDKLFMGASQPLRDGMDALREKAAYATSGRYPYSRDAILQQLLPR